MTILDALKGLYAKLGGKKSPDNIQTIGEALEDITTVTVNGSDALPAVTAVDNGDVLTVVEGAWTKAAPAGGGVYNVTAAYDDSGEEGVYVLNKTWQEIHDAFAEGKTILVSYENLSEGFETSGIAAVYGIAHNSGSELTEGYVVGLNGGSAAITETANGYPVASYM